MSNVVSIGEVPWRREDMVASLEEFDALYARRPIRDNRGGMKSPQMFLSWFALRALAPKAVIESGVWLGQGTWFFEQACPDAELYCLDPNLERIQHRSPRATYYDRDFTAIDWTSLPRSDTVVFFDDHQNGYERLQAAKWAGFRHVMFEDNYAVPHGDCYSLKRAFAHAGFATPAVRSRAKLAWWVRNALLGPRARPGDVAPNDTDATYLRENLEVYYEFPPVFKARTTRWGDPWDDRYPTPPPLLERVDAAHQQRFLDEAAAYTWICYARLAGK
jgi:hypothetical protein